MIADQVFGEDYALYHADSCKLLPTLPSESVHLSIYSPPFTTKAGGLYNYSSSEFDLSNARSGVEFFEHYEYIASEIARVLLPGRITAVHCMDVPTQGANICGYSDFPGDIIKLHEANGFRYAGRHMIWKEPLEVRLRTMQKNLAHASLVADSLDCGIASGDFLLLFRKVGKNPVPVTHPVGMLDYAGERTPPADVLSYRGYTGKQTENRFSHWIWRQYADCMWDDIRINRVLPYRDCREEDDEKHVHPLQLDVIDRCVVLFSNPGETCFTPFMGVGSEVYSPVMLGRRGMGAELKTAYFRQAVKNVEMAAVGMKDQVETLDMFDEQGMM